MANALSAGPAVEPAPPPWRLREPALLAALIALIAWAYWPTVRELSGAGERSDTHFAFVGPAFAWLAWERLDEIRGLPLRPWWPGLIALALLVLAWTLGELVFVRIVTDAAVVAMLPAAVLALMGPAWVRALAFPLGFLVFAIPFWAPLVPALANGTAEALAIALPLSGIPMQREGAFFSIPSGLWAVADACSGVEYLGACAILGALMAGAFFTSWKKRAAFMAAALAVGIAGNWLRAYLVVVIAHLSDNRLLRDDHGWFGWALYALMLAALGWAGWRHREPAPTSAPAHPQPKSPPASRRALSAAIAVLLVLAAWPRLLPALLHRDAPAAPPRIANIVPANGWRAVPPDPARWAPRLHRPAAFRTQSFEKDGRRVDVHIGLFVNQSWDSKLVDARHRLADPEAMGWAEVDSGEAWVNLNGEARRVNAVSLRGPASGAQAWQWYEVDGQATADGVTAKLLQLQSLPGADAAAIWVAVSAGAADATALMHFAREMPLAALRQ